MTKNRLDAFSDGVFAIVITLLILDVRFPPDKRLTLETLRGVLPHVLAFVLRTGAIITESLFLGGATQ